MKKFFFFSFLICYTYMYSQKQDVENYIIAGDSLFKIQDFENSIKAYSDAINISPNIDFYFRRGRVEFSSKNYNDAIDDFTKVIEDKNFDKKEEAYFYRGMSKLLLSKENLHGCEDLDKAKELGFNADWSGLEYLCSLQSRN